MLQCQIEGLHFNDSQLPCRSFQRILLWLHNCTVVPKQLWFSNSKSPQLDILPGVAPWLWLHPHVFIFSILRESMIIKFNSSIWGWISQQAPYPSQVELGLSWYNQSYWPWASLGQDCHQHRLGFHGDSSCLILRTMSNEASSKANQFDGLLFL